MLKFIKNHFSYLLVVIVIITLENIYIFYHHYFDGYGFPWDFLETYLAVPYYWVNCIRNNINPMWVPFQGMGYPLYMNLQSGYYYIPLWIFTIIGKGYLASNAVLFECVHILLGSIGAYYCGRLNGLNKWNSLLLAIIYQTFGGFYTNAQHTDIIRGYSFIPWLFAGVLNKEWDLKNNWFLIWLLLSPALFYLFITGSYIGIIISTIFIFSILIIIRAINEKKILIPLCILMSICIAILLSGYFITPIIMFHNDFIRSSQNLVYDTIKPLDIFCLIFKNTYQSLSHDISMKMSSIGCISFLFIMINLNYNKLKENYIIIIGLILSLLMTISFIHGFVVGYMHVLGMSRFVLSDYKGIFSFLLILLSCKLLDNYKMTTINFMRLFYVVLFIIAGGFFLDKYSPDIIHDMIYIAIIILGVYLTLRVIKNNKYKYLVLIILAIIDWGRIHSGANYFNTSGVDGYIESTFGDYKSNNSKLIFKAMVNQSRSSRLSESHNPYNYQGYYNSNYMMYDYGGSMRLKQYEYITESNHLNQFAQESWNVRVVMYGAISNIKSSGFLMRNYGNDTIVSKVDLKESGIYVENEIYWPGWTTYIVNESIQTELKVFDIDGFRGWSLPKGNYFLVEKFMNVTSVFAMLTVILGLLIWCIMAYIVFIRRKNDF